MLKKGFLEGVDSLTNAKLRSVIAQKTNELRFNDRGSIFDSRVRYINEVGP